MLAQSAPLREGLLADRALVGFLATVDNMVVLEVAFRGETLLAYITQVHFGMMVGVIGIGNEVFFIRSIH